MSTQGPVKKPRDFTNCAHISKADVKTGLARLGIRQGDVLLAHSSLSRFGYVDGGPDAVIDALLESVGPEGTVIMSAITTNWGIIDKCITAADSGGLAEIEPFDVVNRKCWAGTISETFRKRPGVKRSFHPTHSVSAFGARADEMIASHENAPGPCGEGTPYARVTQIERGFILMLGVNHNSNTAMHGMEELAGCEYVLYPKWARIPIITPNGPAESRTRVHLSYMGRRLGALETQYIDGCGETVTLIGDSYCRLVNGKKMREITLAALAEDPWLLLAPEGMKAYAIMKETGVYNRNPLKDQKK